MPSGFLLAEDAAVKGRFSNLTVSDDRKTERPVQVFFRYPEGETERSYPFITIELLDIIHARNRQHSETTIIGSTDPESPFYGPNSFDYWPSEYSGFSEYAEQGPLASAVDFIPVDLLYQVSTFTRSALHDRQLTARILSRTARFRWGYIHIPEDDTIRRFDLLDWVTADLLDPEAGYRKRIFRKVYTIQMNAELTVSDLLVAQKVLTVNTAIIDKDTGTTETVVAP
jgi:hypothetical protein